MPVKSKAQWGWLGVHRPDLLHKWQKESPKVFKKLPPKTLSRKKDDK